VYRCTMRVVVISPRTHKCRQASKVSRRVLQRTLAAVSNTYSISAQRSLLSPLLNWLIASLEGWLTSPSHVFATPLLADIS